MVGEDGRSGKLANLNNIDAVQSTERCTNTAMLRMKLVTKCASVKPIYLLGPCHACGPRAQRLQRHAVSQMLGRCPIFTVLLCDFSIKDS